MAGRFLVPDGEAVCELAVRNSRFLGRARACLTADEARDLVKRERAEHPGASHVVHAFILGDPRSETSGLSDDGEPRGTAGRPVFEVLKGSGIRNVLLTVTRWFGGTKLGTGGLVKAYGACAKETLKRLPTRVFLPLVRARLELSYHWHEPARRALAAAGGRVLGGDFGETVRLELELPEQALEDFRAALGAGERSGAVRWGTEPFEFS